MPSGRDVVLKIGTDIREAIDGFRKVRQEAEETNRTVDATTTRIDRLSSRIRASEIGQGLRAGANTLASGGSFGEAGLAVLEADPRIRAAIEAFRLASALDDRFSGRQGQIKTGNELLDHPRSVDDLVEGLRTTSEEEAKSARNIGRHAWDVVFHGQWRNREDQYLTRQLFKEKFRAMVKRNQYEALAVLQAEGNPEDLQKIYDEETKRATESEAFLKSLQPQKPSTVVNVYATMSGPNDGESLRAYQDRADRNSGKNQTITTP